MTPSVHWSSRDHLVAHLRFISINTPWKEMILQGLHRFALATYLSRRAIHQFACHLGRYPARTNAVYTNSLRSIVHGISLGQAQHTMFRHDVRI